MLAERKNALEAAIKRLGGRGRGIKQLSRILNLTTARVYQLRSDGVVPKPAQAVLLELATGIPYEAFLAPGPWIDPPADSDHMPSRGLTEEHARILADETGIPLEAFAIRASGRRPVAGRAQATPSRTHEKSPSGIPKGLFP